jgi:hypothetical protein
MVELTNAIPTREASSPSSWHELRVRKLWCKHGGYTFSYNASSGRYGVIVYKDRPVNEWIIIKMGSKQRALKKKFRKGSHVKLTILKGSHVKEFRQPKTTYTLQVPALSPDMNPIEYLWDFVEPTQCTMSKYGF